jgi:3D (Asp-Asp-Asp) domain-containing protein
MILGLLHSEATGLERLGNFRRTVFYQYPNGAAPLIALLSMLKTEDTNDPTFTIYEKRFAEQRTTTASANAAGPFTATGGTTDATVAGFNMAINSGSRIKVADTSVFRVGHIIQIKDVPNGAATAIMTLKGLITLIVDATSFEVRWLEAYTSVSNDTDANALDVTVIGAADRLEVRQDGSVQGQGQRRHVATRRGDGESVHLRHSVTVHQPWDWPAVAYDGRNPVVPATVGSRCLRHDSSDAGHRRQQAYHHERWWVV